jgi:LPS export ABC transporter protein LptC
LAIVLLLAGCPGGQPEETASSAKPSPGITLEGAQLTETRDGQKIWDLKAAHVAYRTDVRVAELSGVTTHFYEKGKVVSTGKAPKATFNLGDRELRLEDGIEVRAEGGHAGFSADEVSVKPDPGRLVASGRVTFFRGDNRLVANQLVADRSLKRVELSAGVRGRFSLAPQGTPVLPLPSQGI